MPTRAGFRLERRTNSLLAGAMKLNGMFLRLTIIMAASLLVGSVSTSFSWAQSPNTNIGTLTCLLSPASEERFGVEREVSCEFDPLTGARAELRGIIKRIGAPVSDQGKVAMVWTVFAPSLDTPASNLQGNYAGTLGAQPKDGLIGGVGSSIHLKPLAAAPDFVDAVLSVLELELMVMRA